MPTLTSDEKWKHFNKKLILLIEKKDLFSLGTTYYEMAEFLRKEGKNPDELRDFGYKFKLRSILESLERYKDSGVIDTVQILADQESCNQCKELNNKILNIEEAIVSSPIPVKNCKHKYGCRCCYIPAILKST